MNKDEPPELPGTEDLKDPFKKNPKGMPAVSLVKAEALRLGLEESDGEAIYDSWLANGFRTRAGPIKDWKAAMRVWHRNNWFPSQKKAGYKKPSTQQEALDRIRKAKGGS